MLPQYWRLDKSFPLIHFIVANFDIVESLNNNFIMLLFIIIVLIHLILLNFFFWWNNYFLNNSWILIKCKFWFHNFFSDFTSYRLFCCFSCFIDTILAVVFAASGPVFVAVSNKFFPYLLVRFLVNDKNPYPLNIFLFLVQ